MVRRQEGFGQKVKLPAIIMPNQLGLGAVREPDGGGVGNAPVNACGWTSWP